MQNNKLYRSRKDKVIGGVAGGLADYFNIDPVLIRIIFVATTIFKGFGLLAYIVLWIAVPENPNEQPEVKSHGTGQQEGEAEAGSISSSDHSEKKETGEKHERNRLIAGIILVTIGLLFLFDNLFAVIDLVTLASLVLVLVGASLIWNYKSKNKLETENQ